MANRKGPVLLWGPAAEHQPWIAADVAMIRDYLQRKYGMIGVIYNVCQVPSFGYWFMNVGT